MKKLFTLISFCSFSMAAFSQISLTSLDMPYVNWSQKVIKDTLPLPSINYGNKGANQVYDFSALSPFKYDTINYLAPTGPQLTSVPGSDLAVTLDGVNFLFTKTVPTKQTLQGFAGVLLGSNLSAYYNPVPDVYHFPTQYNGKFNGTSKLVKIVSGASVGITAVDSVRLTLNSTYFDTIDGWGKVKTPIGSYKCLRENRKDVTQTIVDIKLAIPFAQWSNYSNTSRTTVRYNYLTKETKGSVITFDYDSVDNLLAATYSQIPPAPLAAKFVSKNTSGGIVQLTDSTDGYPDTYQWSFGDGSPTSNATNPSHTYAANGAYYVCVTVTNTNSTNSYCDSVHVTGIASTPNNAPLAVRDTASVLQPNSKIINVGNNDSDPDGNAFCVTTVYGSANFSVAVTGNCTSVKYAPDSLFIGKDSCWYVICDNGTPSLCDTAVLVVQSLYNKALLPVASTIIYDMNCGGFKIISTSLNADSLVWKFQDLRGLISTVINIDTVIFKNADSYDLRGQVCLTIYNKYGTSQKCDSVFGMCSGIEFISMEGIKLYPNPTSNLITIDMSENEEEISRNFTAIEIYNLLGEKVKIQERKDAAKLITISLADLPNGMYLASILDSKGAKRMLGRFVKE